MPRNSHRNHFGFSLIELVIVLIIMGVIAAIAIPRLNRSAKTSGASALKQDLATIRKAIELYAVEHGGKYPGDDIALQLTMHSNFSGDQTNAMKDPPSGIVYGPYLKEIPPLPVGSKKGATGILVEADLGVTLPLSVTADISPSEGWWYNKRSLVFHANLPDGDLDDDGVPYSTY